MCLTVLELLTGLLVAAYHKLLETCHLLGISNSTQVLLVTFRNIFVVIFSKHNHKLYPICPVVVVTAHRTQYYILCCKHVVIFMPGW